MKTAVTYEVWEQVGGYAPEAMYLGLTLEAAEARRATLTNKHLLSRRAESAVRRYTVVRATTTFEEVG
jgi:hypothetical protein